MKTKLWSLKSYCLMGSYLKRIKWLWSSGYGTFAIIHKLLLNKRRSWDSHQVVFFCLVLFYYYIYIYMYIIIMYESQAMKRLKQSPTRKIWSGPQKKLYWCPQEVDRKCDRIPNLCPLLGNKTGQKTADFHEGTIKVPRARQHSRWKTVRDTRYKGGK